MKNYPTCIAVTGYCEKDGRNTALVVSFDPYRYVTGVNRDCAVCRWHTHCKLYNRYPIHSRLPDDVLPNVPDQLGD